MKVLLAIDNSEFSNSAIQAVIDEMKPANAEIRVLTVVDLINYFSTNQAAKAFIPEINELRRERLKGAGELLDRAVKRLKAEGFKVSSGISEGDVRSRIIETAAEWGADVIVLGSHSRKGFDRALIGSVSEAVARHARCSVEIVRPPITKPPQPEQTLIHD